MMRLILFGVCSSLLMLVSCVPSRYPLTATSERNFQLDTAIAEDSIISSFISPYRQKLSREMDQVIGYFEEDMRRHDGTGNLDVWIANALYDYASEVKPNLDVAIHNSGGIRLPIIEKGPVLRSTIYELSPFDNYLVFMTLKGSTLERLIQHLHDQGGWPVSRHLNYRVHQGEVVEILINGIALDDQEEYLVALQDYIANGGDDSAFLKAIPQEETGIFIRDILIRAVQEGYTVPLDELKAKSNE